MNKKARTVVTSALVAIGGIAPTGANAQTTDADGRIIVRTVDDLPRRTYAVSGRTLELIRDEVVFNALLDQLLADTLDDLRRYRIDDPSTLRGYYDFLILAYSAKGDLETALAYSNRSRDLEQKEEAKYMRGVVLRARIAGKAVDPDESSAAFRAAFKAELRRQVSALPFEPIKDELVGLTSQAKLLTPQLIEQSISASLDPLIANAGGQVSSDIAAGLVNIHQTLEVALPLLPAIAEVYGEIIAANEGLEAEVDLWTPRLIELDPNESGTPVVIGIWDSGVDISLYSKNLWTNPRETANGRDDDGNGFVDDIHGIAFSLDRYPTTGALADLSGLHGDRDELLGYMIAAQDMQYGIENEAVAAFREHFASLDGEGHRTFGEDLSLIGSWAHGTHVAGVAIDGNPFARILHITENWPWKTIPAEAPTVELGERWGDNFRQSVEYLDRSGARVVNMSWRMSRAAFEGMLTAKGAGASPQERAALSREIFAAMHKGLEEAIASAPHILFVAGSGNEDNDVDFNEYIPAGLRLPNLLTVGAIDHRDRFTSFTSTGADVELYANGYRIESFVPGGQRVKFSGTSMAAPQVANLAAKLLAIDPGLTPAEVIALIRSNADELAEQPGRLVINPRRTVQAIR